MRSTHLPDERDPEEGYKLGEEYQFGAILGAHRTNLQSLFLPDTETILELLFLFMTTGLVIVLFAGNTFIWFTISILFMDGYFLAQFLLPRFTARHTRFYFYERGFIYIQPGSIVAVSWERVERTVYFQWPELFKTLWAIYLHGGDKIEVNRYLDRRNNMRRILSIKTSVEEANSKKQSDKYIDIGHLAD